MSAGDGKAPLTVGIAGLGTVGSGTLRALAANAEALALRCGRPIRVVAVSARDRGKDRGLDLSGCRWLDDPLALAADPEVEVVVELIGGSDGPAKALVEAALQAGKPVVTANKALLAHHGTALAQLAEAKGVGLCYEAAVAGGIPVIGLLRDGLAGNRVQRVAGILNGTCNYILTTMRESGREFADVLAEAQALGYAEADPSFDIDGVDAAHKLAILTALAFGCAVDFEAVRVEGIRDIAALDIGFAEELGLRIKLLGVATAEAEGVAQRVEPVMVPLGNPLAAVEGVFNAVLAKGDFVGTIMAEGAGAGERPTASAVVADLAAIARGYRRPVFGVPAAALTRARPVPAEGQIGAYYLRLMVIDRPGVIAEVAAALRDEEISVEALLQRGRAPGEIVPVVITTHETTEGRMRRAVARIDALEACLESPRLIRIEGE
ncbi:homoserine dehydrogenase [Tistlia consotensis]|uniref:Homoserine dehydrogenase n=1 Tax=Tistlia consotensis USBA 355 TaxID=560819 RepID=A0A1Y6BQJ9_9PROT|nr:homoserine dehydrogenase [Tistlia consotensis]SMF20584.1 homoserine dehydrogenase [Tistlia consotensis USBA 355]SNR47777.1 homoserine dehydrogenase [Tistlia consotensis]